MKHLSMSLLLILMAAFSFAQEAQMEVKKPVYFDISPALRDMSMPELKSADASWKDGVVKNYFDCRVPMLKSAAADDLPDYNIQRHQGLLISDSTIQNFDGVGSTGYIPPDTDGDVGPDHYFQVVNSKYAIYNKNGIKLFGPVNSSTIWQGMPNNSNDGDAVVLYDEAADRWLFSQFSLPNYPNGPFYQMIAVSQTPDPTGSWYRYQYSFTTMPDYPKFGIWPDGYYMSCNRFTAGSGYYTGTGAAAFNRTKMIAGDPGAEMIYFTLPSSNEAYSMLPSDCDGTFPAAGTPNYFVYEYDASPYHLGILEFHADWNNTSNSTFGNLSSIPVSNFNPSIGTGITQKGTTTKLSTLSDRLMYRLQFKNFGTHWSMVCNHSVNASSGIAGIRWYELRKTTGAWTKYQEGTYAPADNLNRWMGSIAMDDLGNIALGYSVSGSALYPSIRYTGRLANDPLNTMTITEGTIIEGGGCQTSSTKRWGDYSSMRVDGTTFWYTTEYYETTGNSSWKTRIGSFTLATILNAEATAYPVKVCIGDSSQLTAISYGGSGNYTYSWTSIPSGFTSGQQNPKVAPGDTTQYVLAVNDGINTRYDTTAVNIIHYPVVSAGNDTIVCDNVTSIEVHGTATASKAVGWSTTGNGHFEDQYALNTIYYFGTLDYSRDSVDLRLVAVPLSPCTGSIESIKNVELQPCTGIAGKGQTETNIQLLPNPAKESVKIIISGLESRKATLSLLGIDGRTLFVEEISTSTGSIEKTIGLNYPAGIYLVIISTETGKITRKLIVE